MSRSDSSKLVFACSGHPQQIPLGFSLFDGYNGPSFLLGHFFVEFGEFRMLDYSLEIVIQGCSPTSTNPSLSFVSWATP